MKHYLTAILFFTFFCNLLEGQSKMSPEEILGFSCGFGGAETEVVKKTSSLLAKNDFNSIITLVDSNNNANLFLAIIIVEKLNNLKKIEISEELNQKILAAYNSNKMVAVCSGCTYWDFVSLKTLLDRNNTHHMKESTDIWLDKILNGE